MARLQITAGSPKPSLMPRRWAIYNRAAGAAKGLICAALLTLPTPAGAEPMPGIAMHGSPAYGPDFQHLRYVNPDAPKGGRLVLGVLGSFDSVNPSIVKGEPAAGGRELVLESLMGRALDEPFSLYGLLAESIETPPDRSWVAFTLRPEARFSDGKPVTVEDVIFTMELLRDHGRPNHHFFYSKVALVEKIGERTVKFTFTADGDREMPLIMGLMPIMPRHRIDPETFGRTTLEPIIGSGPYRMDKIEPGASITYRRDPDYWGRNLPLTRGRFNFDEIRYEYYRDGASMFEAFKKGLYQLRTEDDPGKWATTYNFPAVRDGRVEKAEFSVGTPAGMSGLVFNTRRPIFADARVRQALILMFDFDWINHNLYHGLYDRTQSYFTRSDLSSHGRPADEHERALLAPYPDAVKPAVMDGTYALPEGDASGRNRENRRKALALLGEAGYALKGGKLVNSKTGAPFTFEILAATKGQERLLLSYARMLKQIGIDVSLRQVDAAQYQRRLLTFDFDMIQFFWAASLSPGNEQTFRWSRQAAKADGSYNYPGVDNPAVDAMIQALLAERSRDGFVSAVRALDRVLISGDYVIPLFHLPNQWVAYWKSLDHPKTVPLDGIQIDTWWSAGE